MSFEIKKAVRTSQPALICLWGGSFTGKTYSALRMARGLVGPEGKIGVIDTENRRALMYAGQVGGEWHHLDFQPPFTPQRYTEAFRAFEHWGCDCIIVDSASHVWEGEGGVLDQADASTAGGLKKWQAPKMAFKRMVNALLRSQCHVIFCLRAKESVRQEGKGRDLAIVSNGLAPITEKNFIFEMTVSILMGPDQKPMFRPFDDRWRCSPMIPPVKAPGEVLASIKQGEHLSESTGEALRKWLNGATRDLPDEARRAAERGTAALQAWWNRLAREEKVALQPAWQAIKAAAATADDLALRQREDEESGRGEEMGEDDDQPGDYPFGDQPEPEPPFQDDRPHFIDDGDVFDAPPPPTAPPATPAPTHRPQPQTRPAARPVAGKPKTAFSPELFG